MGFNYNICVIGGCGRVGLPFAISFADYGRSVVIYDINEKAMEYVSSKRMPFMENGAEDVLKKVFGKNLFISRTLETLSEAEYIVITIGTPVDEHANPKFTTMFNLVKSILPYIKDEHTIVIRSTVYPGTSKMIETILRDSGKKTNVVYCPERISEGYAMEELRKLPQIISGFTRDGILSARRLFEGFSSEIVELEPFEAELAKLFTNAWRYIKFAISNQFYMIAADYGIDFMKIHKAITKNYPRAQDLPTPGFAAGPCLYKDTMQLSSFSNYNFFLGFSAMLVNEGLPRYIVNLLKRMTTLKDKSVGLLGMAFKGESDDGRESLAYKLRKELQIEMARVYCTDEYIKDPGFLELDELLRRCEIFIISAPHRRYRMLKKAEIERENKILIDMWGITG